MPKREIYQVDKPEQLRILRSKSKKVSNVNDPSLQRLIDDMVDTLHASDIGVGLAAPQVGSLARVIVIELPEDMEDEPMAGKTLVLVNPEITKMEDEWEPIEGCLSYPDWYAEVRRAYRVWAKAKDRKGRDFKINAEGFLAQVIQHEVDHLNGILFFDHLSSMDKLRRADERAADKNNDTPGDGTQDQTTESSARTEVAAPSR